MQCVILAGGRGTRMEAYTADIPKALIPLHNKPFIDHQLEHLYKTGVTDVLLSIGYKGDQIREHVKDGKAWKMQVRYVIEGPDLLGTGGALRLAFDKEKLQQEFLVTYGDSFLPIDFSTVWRYFQSKKDPVLMTVFKNEGRWETSNVIYKEERVVLYQKNVKNPEMAYVDYGLLAMRQSWVAKSIPQGPCDLSDVLHAASQKGEIAGMEVTTRFYESGSPEGLKDLDVYLKNLKS